MDKLPIYVFAKWQIKKEHLNAVLKLIPEVIKKSRKEKGNLIYKIHQSRSDSNTLILFEGYKDAVSLDDHRNSKHFQEVIIKQIVPLLESREIELTSEILSES